MPARLLVAFDARLAHPRCRLEQVGGRLARTRSSRLCEFPHESGKLLVLTLMKELKQVATWY